MTNIQKILLVGTLFCIVLMVSVFYIWETMHVVSILKNDASQPPTTSTTGPKKVGTKEFLNAHFAFMYPSTYSVIETAEGVYHISPDPNLPVDQLKLQLVATSSKTYTSEVEIAKQNIENPIIENLSKGVLISGRQIPGAMGGVARYVAVYDTTPNPILLDLFGDNQEDIAAFNTIAYSFESKR